MHDGGRPERVASDIHAILARTLHEEVKDPRVSDVSITAVRMSRDLSLAHINVVPLGGQGDPARMLAGLEAAAGFLRHAVGQQLRLRHTPELRFHVDDRLDDSLRMATLLTHMEQAREPGLDGDPDEE